MFRWEINTSMKILAVIPARAGSKGIPNKNIRIIGGKPLISYCIENAKDSKYITDIIVTSDSAEIELIAKYYDVDFHMRDSGLCGDDITLDAVIYDACKEYEADYIITMQPTSPTLLTTTLDRAIEYAIENDFDTVISAVNRPHLAWIEEGGGIVPDYKERVNRQYMPKRYLETGAFVISKYEAVSEKTRIGKKVSVFEIADKEAIDIDSFQDLLGAEQILRERKTAIVVNGNNQIGLGHICRMLELADTFYFKPDFFYDERITKEDAFGNTTYNLIPYKKEEDLICMLSEKGYQLVINDILDTSNFYMENIKKLNSKVKIVNFEDLGEGNKYADLVFNALYSKKSDDNRCFNGENYYLAPKLFYLYKNIEIKNKVKNVFVCFGGADPQGYTEMLLSLIHEKIFKDINFVIVLGRAKKNAESIIAEFSTDNVEILYDAKNMPEIISRCDLAVTSRGRTCYELAMLGVPTIAMAQNRREELHEFASEKNGFVYLGIDVDIKLIEDTLVRLIYSSSEERQIMQNRMLEHDLKNGRERIKNLINSLL